MTSPLMEWGPYMPGDLAELRHGLWPAFLFARRADLLATDRIFGDRGWPRGGHIAGWGPVTPETCAFVGIAAEFVHLDTFFGTTLQLRAAGLRTELVHRVRVFDERATEEWVAADPPWFHVTGLSTLPGVLAGVDPCDAARLRPRRRAVDAAAGVVAARRRGRVGVPRSSGHRSGGTGPLARAVRAVGHVEGGGTMNIVLLLAHSIEEHDQLRLLSGLGYDVFSLGGYIDPAHPHDPKRPALPDVPYHPDLQAAVDALGTTDNLRYAKERIPDVVLDWADTIICHHHEEVWLVGQWDRIRHKRVIWRTVGQSVENNERMMTAAPRRRLADRPLLPEGTEHPRLRGRGCADPVLQGPGRVARLDRREPAGPECHAAPTPARAVHELGLLGSGHARAEPRSGRPRLRGDRRDGRGAVRGHEAASPVTSRLPLHRDAARELHARPDRGDDDRHPGRVHRAVAHVDLPVRPGSSSKGHEITRPGHDSPDGARRCCCGHARRFGPTPRSIGAEQRARAIDLFGMATIGAQWKAFLG